MSMHGTKLKEIATGNVISAAIDDELQLDSLFEAEEQWCLSRVRMLQEITVANVPRHEWPQSLHWSWAYKAAVLGPDRLEALGDARLFGIKAAGQWQGLMLALCVGHYTRLGRSGRPLVYIDFLESAPWNWSIKRINRVGRYRSVGAQLMELAIRWSLDLDYHGRVGLHALKQSEPFYTTRCRMINLGSDAHYHDLSYFELSEAAAIEFLGVTHDDIQTQNEERSVVDAL